MNDDTTLDKIDAGILSQQQNKPVEVETIIHETETIPAGDFETPTEPTVDDLFHQFVSEEGVKQIEKDSILPVGTYTTIPEFKVTLGEKDGRKNARLFGRIFKTDENDEETKGAIGYPLSWERRNKIESIKDKDTGIVIEKKETDKPDYLSKNFAQAVKAYTIAFGEAPTELDKQGNVNINVGKVISYLRDYPHKLRIIQTQNNENMVVAISAVVEK